MDPKVSGLWAELSMDTHCRPPLGVVIPFEILIRSPDKGSNHLQIPSAPLTPSLTLSFHSLLQSLGHWEVSLICTALDAMVHSVPVPLSSRVDTVDCLPCPILCSPSTCASPGRWSTGETGDAYKCPVEGHAAPGRLIRVYCKCPVGEGRRWP